jgi:hypothetical protein
MLAAPNTSASLAKSRLRSNLASSGSVVDFAPSRQNYRDLPSSWRCHTVLVDIPARWPKPEESQIAIGFAADRLGGRSGS